MEEVLFEVERRRSREEIAGFLRSAADRLEAGEPITLSGGGDSLTLDVPARPTFEVKAERETDGHSSELSVEFELEWDENGEADDAGADDLEIR